MKIRDWGVSLALVASTALFWGGKAKPAENAAVEGELEEVDEEVQKPAWADLGDVPFVELGGLDEPEEYLQWAIDKARWWKGVSYRRWLDDGVARSSAAIQWGDPGDGSE
jgi:hypothetical protein